MFKLKRVPVQVELLLIVFQQFFNGTAINGCTLRVFYWRC